jgi:hypothetical protein
MLLCSSSWMPIIQVVIGELIGAFGAIACNSAVQRFLDYQLMVQVAKGTAVDSRKVFEHPNGQTAEAKN